MQRPSSESLKDIRAKTHLAYDLVAAKYHELFLSELDQKPYDRGLLDIFADKFSYGSLICDAGCGPSAHIGNYLFERGLDVVGVDLSLHCLKIARETNPGMRFKREDFAEMTFPDGTFSGLVAYHSIIHSPKKSIPGIFKEFHRVLKPDGHLLVAVKAGTEEGYCDEILGTKTQIYFSYFSENEIAEYLTEAGFALTFLDRRKPYDQWRHLWQCGHNWRQPDDLRKNRRRYCRSWWASRIDRNR
jgi:ubiquinone/menaquinone biosynthesis C-methylase UbiE